MILRGEFWLVDGDKGWIAHSCPLKFPTLADNYEENVKPGKSLLMMVDTRLSEMDRDLLRRIWNEYVDHSQLPLNSRTSGVL